MIIPAAIGDIRPQFDTKASGCSEDLYRENTIGTLFGRFDTTLRKAGAGQILYDQLATSHAITSIVRKGGCQTEKLDKQPFVRSHL
ncbi:hypothetical protein AA0475_1629 [Acetobacter peroxydans]|nr:hypothetical protein AA0475_1629 [Acetobacter peroxydans]